MKKFCIFILVVVLGFPFATAETSFNTLTKGFADTIYCRLDASNGNCGTSGGGNNTLWVNTSGVTTSLNDNVSIPFCLILNGDKICNWSEVNSTPASDGNDTLWVNNSGITTSVQNTVLTENLNTTNTTVLGFANFGLNQGKIEFRGSTDSLSGSIKHNGHGTMTLSSPTIELNASNMNIGNGVSGDTSLDFVSSGSNSDLTWAGGDTIPKWEIPDPVQFSIFYYSIVPTVFNANWTSTIQGDVRHSPRNLVVDTIADSPVNFTNGINLFGDNNFSTRTVATDVHVVGNLTGNRQNIACFGTGRTTTGKYMNSPDASVTCTANQCYSSLRAGSITGLTFGGNVASAFSSETLNISVTVNGVKTLSANVTYTGSLKKYYNSTITHRYNYTFDQKDNIAVKYELESCGISSCPSWACVEVIYNE